MFKLNCSDELWVGDEQSKAFEIMLREVEFGADLIEDAVPKEMPEDILHQIDLNIKSCSSRINLQDDKQRAARQIQSLLNELEHLTHPQPNPFHWDVSVYKHIEIDQSDEIGNENNDENEGEDEEKSRTESMSSGNSSENEDVAIGRKESQNMTIDFRVGKQRSVKVGNTYEVGEMVILVGNQSSEQAPFLVAEILEVVKKTFPAKLKVWYYETIKRKGLKYENGKFCRMNTIGNNEDDIGTESESSVLTKFKKLNKGGKLPIPVKRIINNEVESKEENNENEEDEENEGNNETDERTDSSDDQSSESVEENDICISNEENETKEEVKVEQIPQPSKKLPKGWAYEPIVNGDSVSTVKSSRRTRSKRKY